MPSIPTVWVPGKILASTDLSIRFESAYATDWVPLSMIIDSDKDLEKGVELEIELPQWLAEEKEFV